MKSSSLRIQMGRSVPVLLVVCVAVVLLATVACSREGSAAPGGDWVLDNGEGVLPSVDPFGVNGDILIAGSSTVYPLSESIAARFIDEGYTGNVSIQSVGTGGGFERFCTSAETDIANASRPIKAVEVDNCRGQGREPLEFRVATDALVIAVNPQNSWVRSVTVEQLAQIFTAVQWSDVDPAWPREDIQRFVPGTDSGTFDFFVEEVFHKDTEPLLSAPNIQLSEDDNILLRGIAENKNGIGFFGYAYYINNRGKIDALSVEGVAISNQSVLSNDYPLSRPLFMYSDAAIMQAKPQVAAFIAYSIDVAVDESEKVGYFAIDSNGRQLLENLWLNTMQGYY